MTVSETMVAAALKAAPQFWRDTRDCERHMRAALTAALSDQSETIRACARSTLIGFQTELGDRNIEFICDQIARKATLSDQVVVPKAALDWLNGEGPDADGKWFGDTEPRVVPGKTWPRYWWRSKFRAMIAPPPREVGSE